MYDTPHAGVETVRTSSMFAAAWAVYAEWIGQHGAVILTTIGITYGLFQFWARHKEHKVIMRKARKEGHDE